MIRYAGVGVILILMYTEVRAEIMYVSEISKITSRAGPGIEYKVISEIRTGQPVEITQQGRWWTRIRLSDGREGFVLSRFLTKKKPNQLLLDELKEKYQTLKLKVKALREENKKQRDEKKRLLAELTGKKEILEQLTKSYETLMAESPRFIDLRENYRKKVSQLEDQTKNAEKYEEALSQFRRDQIFKWMLTGVGLLLMGFLIGMISNRQRRRSAPF
jgi:SH3 domain protein